MIQILSPTVTAAVAHQQKNDSAAGFITIIASTPKSISQCSPIIASAQRKQKRSALGDVTRNLFGDGTGAKAQQTAEDDSQENDIDDALLSSNIHVESDIADSMLSIQYLSDQLAEAGLFDIQIHEPSEEEEELVSQSRHQSNKWHVSEVIGHLVYYITVPLKKVAAKIAAAQSSSSTMDKQSAFNLSLLEQSSHIEQLDMQVHNLSTSIETAVSQIRAQFDDSAQELSERIQSFDTQLSETVSSNRILEDICRRLQSQNDELHHEVALLRGLRDEDSKRHAELTTTIGQLKLEINEKVILQQSESETRSVEDAHVQAQLQSQVRSLTEEIHTLMNKMQRLEEEKSALEMRQQATAVMVSEETQRREAEAQDSKIKALEKELAIIKASIITGGIAMPFQPALPNPLLVPPMPRFFQTKKQSLV